ncbi:MAG: SusE domain-containing protein, partial [Bacteroidota bacterium]
GSFNPGLYSQLSNNNGADTLLTLTVSQIDALLGSLGVQQGDSINVKWTVKSFTASDSLNAAQSFNLLLVRQAPAPQLGVFNLLTPANNARLVISSANPGSAVINWTRSTNAIRYRWYLDAPAGNFNPGLYSQLSNNSGADTALTLTIVQIDALLGTLGVQRGDSITVKWTVKSFTTTDSLTATQSFNLKLVRERILVAFSLTSPANNSRVVTESGNTTPVSITWGNGQAVSYKWMATLLTGNFSNPLLVLPSDAAGTATALTLTSGLLHATLGTLGVKLGDSVTVRWTVFGYRGVDSLKASNDFVINLVRKRNLGTFGLLSPADNARITVKDNDTNKVVITWQTSAAATQYKWMIDLPTGNFANPIASLLSDNSGTATTLTLSSGAISTLLGNAGVAKGDSINLKWTVRALETNVDSILANTSFQLKAVRLKDVNIGLAKQLGRGIHLYPNPVIDKLHVSNELGISVSYTLFDVNGKALRSGVCDNEMIIDMSEYANGIYLIVLANGDAKTHHKLIKNQ